MNTEAATKVCELAGEISPESKGLFLHEMHRYSSRKKESLDWSGMLGSLTFSGELAPFIPWLNAARILHIGRTLLLDVGRWM